MAYEQKTRVTDQAVSDYIFGLPTDKRRAEAETLTALFEEVTGYPAKMWGPSIIGFGAYSYRYASGHSGEAARVGFSPRKAAISLYLFLYDGALDGILSRLGKHKASKGCVYVNKLEDIDLGVLKEAVRESLRLVDDLYPESPSATPTK